MTDRAPKIESLSATAPATTALVADVTMVAEAPFAGTVTEASYIPDAAVTGAASPASRTVSVINRGQAGTGTTVVATLALLGGVNLVAGDERALTLSATPANLVVAVGDVLAWSSDPVGGTGLADPGGLVAVGLSRS